MLSFQTLFKSGLHTAAVNRYTAAATIAVSRPPWEANQFMREELSTVISNRSAAYYESQDYVAALADAEAVIQVRRTWSKGHFRKAKALLGMNRLKEAADAVKLGLSFEPSNTVRCFSFESNIGSRQLAYRNSSTSWPRLRSGKRSTRTRRLRPSCRRRARNQRSVRRFGRILLYTILYSWSIVFQLLSDEMKIRSIT